MQIKSLSLTKLKMGKQKDLTEEEKSTIVGKTDSRPFFSQMSAEQPLDGPDGWCRGWLVKGCSKPSRVRQQQGGGGVMFWAGIIGNELVSPFKVPDGVKMNVLTYRNFLQDFIPWYRGKRPAFKKKIIFMQDNAPSHAALRTYAVRRTINCADRDRRSFKLTSLNVRL